MSEALLETPFQPVQAEEAERLANAFGIEAEAVPLTGERDQNFRLVARDGRNYVLKITNPAEPVSIGRFQSQALLHIACQAPDLPVPRVLPTTDGDHELVAELGGVPRVVRVLSYLEGALLYRVSQTSLLRRHIGATLARLGQALSGFEHPVARRELLWDLKRTPSLRDYLHYIEEDEDVGALVKQAIDNFEHCVVPKQGELRSQVIHNDFNPHNLLVGGDPAQTVTGVLDFGDIVHAPLVNDLAVAAAYHVANEHPVAAVCDVFAGYCEVEPLLEEETELLFDLIVARLAMTVAITSWRAASFPENSTYILRNNPGAQAGLRSFATLDRTLVIEQLHGALAKVAR